jgi:hypothetical protein
MKKTYYRPEIEIESLIMDSNFLDIIGSIPGENGPGNGGAGGPGGPGADVNLNISFDEDEEVVDPKWDSL